MSMDNNKNNATTATEVAGKSLKASATAANYITGIDYGGVRQYFDDYAMGELKVSADNKAFIDARKKPEEKLSEEEWIWVTGYKGTYRDMKCKNDYQFEVGKKFDMPEDAVISTCCSGFHFCPKLKDVFGYYAVGAGHRFFEVSALVRAKEHADCVAKSIFDNHFLLPVLCNNKLAAKSIIFTRELTIDEILTANGVDFSDWTEEEKTMAIENGVYAVKHTRQAKQLVELGYSEAFAKWIVKRDDFGAAYAVGQQKDLSMDMKVAAILG